MNKRQKSKPFAMNQAEDANDLDPIDLLITDFEKFNDVERSFNQIMDIENEAEKVKLLIDFSRFLSSNGFFMESKVFISLMQSH